jgi:DivIVA domain-containing protein
MADKNRSQEPAPAAGPDRLTPVDVQQKQFRLAFRGYNEREVDEFLDQVTEELARLHAENRRWQEELGERRTMPLSTVDPAEADQILSRARRDAGRMLAEAEAEARALVADARRAMGDLGTVGAAELGSTATAAGDFLGREKEFLQRLAGIIQEHAEAVKRDLRHEREMEAARPVQAPAIETGPEPAEPSISGVTRTAPWGAEPSVETEYEAPVPAEPQPSSVGQPEPEESAWIPSKPEVEVVQSASPAESPTEAPWESTAVVEPAVEPGGLDQVEAAEPPSSEPLTAEPEPAMAESSIPEPAMPESSIPEPAMPESSIPEPAIPAWSGTQDDQPAPEPEAEPQPEPEPRWARPDAEPAPSWASNPTPDVSTVYPVEPEPETVSAADAGFGEDVVPEVTPEPSPAPSWEPTTRPSSWGDPQQEEAPMVEEPPFEQPTLTGEPGPRPSEPRPEPDDDAPQAFERGPAGAEEEEDEDRSLRDLFWGED